MSAKNINPKPNDTSEVARQPLDGKLRDLERRIAELTSENTRLQAQLKHQEGIKRQAKALYTSLDRTIEHRLHSKAMSGGNKKTMRIAIDPEVIASSDKQNIVRVAQDYDTNAYFVYRTSQKKSVRLRYRIASKMYRTTRDISVATAKRGYHMIRKGAS